MIVYLVNNLNMQYVVIKLFQLYILLSCWILVPTFASITSIIKVWTLFCSVSTISSTSLSFARPYSLTQLLFVFFNLSSSLFYANQSTKIWVFWTTIRPQLWFDENHIVFWWVRPSRHHYTHRGMFYCI